jgi:predicted MFS family arabinose efflux permease
MGMLFFVPLGDKYERRSLISAMLVLESMALAFAASARSVTSLSIACCVVGALTATVHVIVPLAAHLAPQHERGRVVGIVLSGLLVGVLFARTFSGIVGAQYGWRTVYWFASGLMLALAVTLRLRLQPSRPDLSMKWTKLMRSVASIAREHATLRESALLACLLFMSFSALWTTLVFLMRTPPYHYGTIAVGLFGLLGATSAAAAPIVGKISDRHGPERPILISILSTLAGYVVLLAAGRMLVGLVTGIVLIDLGAQSGHVANQARIYSLVPTARSRINTFYMVAFFLGGALGSYLGPLGFNLAGWAGFCAIPLAALTFALVYFIRGGKRFSRV